MGEESGHGLASSFSLGSPKASNKVSARDTVPFPGITGEGSASELSHWLLVGSSSSWVFGLSVLVPHWLWVGGLPQFLAMRSSLEGSSNRAVCVIGGRRQEESEREITRQKSVFYNLVLEVTSHRFCYILLVRSKLGVQPTFKGSGLLHGC